MIRSLICRPGHVVDSSLPHQLLKFCREIAEGMNYLSSKSFVHRDLAARNILIGADTTCKVSKFAYNYGIFIEKPFTYFPDW